MSAETNYGIPTKGLESEKKGGEEAQGRGESKGKRDGS